MENNNKSNLNLRAVTDKDIRWAAEHLGLNKNAFHGKNYDDPRSDALKNMQTLDVAACPGRGKTTLMVAKLAILAENWSHRTRGICVLSHTNKAREVIEAKLGNTKAGGNLLSYPHYIGTIHGFVNGFLALPWLRSLGYPINVIETEICQKRRWMDLPRNTRESLERKHTQKILAIKLPDFSVGDISWGKNGTLGRSTNTYQDIINVCKQSADDGYFCFDEMFMWANDLLNNMPFTSNTIQSRFPMLFIDEAQDNSEDQSAILNRVFMASDSSVIRQRFGDANQAIYDSMYSKAAETDIFPSENAIDIPNSYRFSQEIANLANPLGLEPIPGGLIGHGPANSFFSGANKAIHTIFIFDENSIDKVMEVYAKLIIDSFSEQKLNSDNFIATAIGQVHRPPDEESDNKFPHHIGSYWPEYDHELSKSDPIPHTFVQYILTGQTLAERKNEAFPAVEKIAEAVLRLSSLCGEKLNYHSRRYKHRFVKGLVVDYPLANRLYECLISTFAIEKSTLTKEIWDYCWNVIVLEIAGIIATENLTGEDVDEFVQWDTTEDKAHSGQIALSKKDNIYHYPSSSPKVKIRMGSIHSVKGDEHTATLVLETFWNTHNLEDIMKWFMKGKSTQECSGVQRPSRMKLHYVAMSRPTHLLCLAMKRSSFEDCNGEIDKNLISKVEAMGWNIQHIRT